MNSKQKILYSLIIIIVLGVITVFLLEQKTPEQLLKEDQTNIKELLSSKGITLNNDLSKELKTNASLQEIEKTKIELSALKERNKQTSNLKEIIYLKLLLTQTEKLIETKQFELELLDLKDYCNNVLLIEETISLNKEKLSLMKELNEKIKLFKEKNKEITTIEFNENTINELSNSITRQEQALTRLKQTC